MKAFSSKKSGWYSRIVSTIGLFCILVNILPTTVFAQDYSSAYIGQGINNTNTSTVGGFNITTFQKTATYKDGLTVEMQFSVQKPALTEVDVGSWSQAKGRVEKDTSGILKNDKAVGIRISTDPNFTNGLFVPITVNPSNISNKIVQNITSTTGPNSFTFLPNTQYYAQGSIVLTDASGVQNGLIKSTAIPFTTLDQNGASITSATTANSVEGTAAPTETGGTPTCSLNFWKDTPNSTLTGCIYEIVNFIIFIPSQYLAKMGGYFLDFFISYSIDSGSYSTSQFPEKGWSLLRDLSNICFIFLLVYAGIRMILGVGKFEAKKIVVNVIIMAILINFSLFFTKLVIDGGNILAHVFYNSINVENKADGSANTGLAGEKGISVALISQVNPQKIIKINTAGTNVSDGNAIAGISILILLCATALNIYFMIMFFKVAFLFLGRVLQLWISMISAPIACISWAGGWGFHKTWWDELWQSSMMAPIFLFFLYLIAAFLNADLVSGLFDNYNSSDFTAIIVAVAVPFAMLAGLMKQAVKYAEKFSTETGKLVAGAAKTATGLALGVATGGLAAAGTRTLGLGAKKLAGSEFQRTLREKESKGGFMGKLYGGVANQVDKGSKRTFDIRNTTAGGAFIKKGMGLDPDNSVLKYAGLNADANKGGYDQKVKDNKKEMEEKIKAQTKSFESTFDKDSDVEAYYNAKHADFVAERNKEEEKLWLADPKNTGKTTADWEKAEKDQEYKEKYRVPAGATAATTLGKPEPKVPTTKREAAVEMKKQYAESLDKEFFIDPLKKKGATKAAKDIIENADKELEAENRFADKKAKLKAKRKLAEDKAKDAKGFEDETEKIEDDVRDLEHEINIFKNEIKELNKEIPKIQNAINANSADFGKQMIMNTVTGKMEEHPDFTKKVDPANPSGPLISSGLSAADIATKTKEHNDKTKELLDKKDSRKTKTKERDEKFKTQYEKKEKVKDRTNIDKDIENLDKEVKQEEERRKAADEKK